MGVIYRDDSEVLEWQKRDPLISFEEKLMEMGLTDQQGIDTARERVLFEVREAIAFAENSPFPDESALLEDVYTAAAGGAG